MVSLLHIIASAFHRYLGYDNSDMLKFGMMNKKYTTYGYSDSRMQLVNSCQSDSTVPASGKGKSPQSPGISNQGYGFLFRGLQINLTIILTFQWKSTKKQE